MENIGKSYFNSIELDNPKSDKWRDNVSAYIIEAEKKEKWVKLFGNEDTIIVGFHNQWLYGKTFVLVASLLLNANKLLKREKNPFSAKDFVESDYNLPAHMRNCPMEVINFLQSLISNLFDFELGNYARNGIERYSLLNKELEEGNLINTFHDYDNNDGVLIVDLTVNKYSFVNVNGDATVRKLPHLKPVDAHTYLKAYYPESVSDLSTDEVEDMKENKTIIKHAEHIKINKKFIKRFKGIGTLSTEELIKIFPTMEGEILEANKIKEVKLA